MNFFQPLAPPPTDYAVANQLTQTSNNTINPDVISDTSSSSSSSSSSSLTSSIIILSIVLSSAIILSVTIYVLLRFLSRRLHREEAEEDVNEIHPSQNHSRSSPAPPHSGETPAARPRSGLDSPLLFKFGSVSGNLTGGDCAVCLSKFEVQDQLRLLPLCCHAFHAGCIDTWLSNHQTCPLCRSTVCPTDADVLDKIRSVSRENEGSFRVEIGSVSRRRGLPDAGAADGGRRRSFPIGSFEYVVDDPQPLLNECEFDSANRREYLEKEFVGVAAPPGESLAEEAGGGSGRNWLKDYVERLASFSFSSQASSFRGSGRFFTGSSRRNDVVVPVDEDLEANGRVGEEISELFRWISGV